MLYSHGTMTDATKSRKIEKESKENEERYCAIYEQSPISTKLFDAQGLFIHANPASLRQLGIKDILSLKNFSLFSDPNITENLVNNLYSGEAIQFQGRYDFDEIKKLNLYSTDREGVTWLSVFITPLIDKKRRISGFLVQEQDITQQKIVEEILLQLTERLSLATTAGGVGIWDYDAVNNILTWDDQVFRLYGIGKERFAGAYDVWKAGIHPDDRIRRDKEIQMALDGEKDFNTEFRVLWPDKSVHYIRALAQIKRDKSGQPLRMVGTNWDITPQKLMEKELRESEERFRIITHSMQFGIVIIDVQTHAILEINQIANDMIGGSYGQVIGSICHQFICPAESGRCPVTDLGQQVHSSERILINKKGEWIPILKTAIKTTLSGKEVLIESFVDISERKKAELALAESERNYRDLFESSHDAIMTIEPPSWKFTSANQSTLELFGAARIEEFTTLGPWDVSPKEQPDGSDSINKSKEMIDTALKKGSNLFEWTHSRIDGHEFPATVLLTRMNRHGIDYIQATVRDITKQKEAENQIRHINKRLSLAADAAEFGIWDLDLISYEIECDNWMHHLYGLNRQDFEGTFKAWKNRIHPEDLPRITEELDQAIQGKKPFDTDFRIVRPDGEIRYIKANGRVIKDRDNRPFRMTGINYDITDRKIYETEITAYAEQLGEQNLTLEELSDELIKLNHDLDEKVRERTEEISHLLNVKTDLITQIGHDLKTPLTSLIALLPYIKKKVENPDLLELLEVVTLDAKRMNQIISNILALANIEIKTPDELIGNSHVAAIIDRVIKAEHHFITQKSLEIKNEISPALVVRMNESHCDLIASNLISNAVKHSIDRGTITIYSEINDEYCCIIVQDNGMGIDSDSLPRIFEEFFMADQSRHDRDSHGLGLSLVQRLVKSYGGTITAESEGIGKGSIFRICFPVHVIISHPE